MKSYTVVDALLIVSIGACIGIHDLTLGAGYLLFLLFKLYQVYKLKQNYKALNAELSKMGYNQNMPGVYSLSGFQDSDGSGSSDDFGGSEGGSEGSGGFNGPWQ